MTETTKQIDLTQLDDHRKGLYRTQAEFARIAGVGLRTYSQISLGLSPNVGVATLEKVLAPLGLRLEIVEA
ncbi:hypothetical protein LCGC14_3108800 [marine sediment metagenome]|uniref:HTH cro/C1-type domain-containing protein n=1 Tax=marine sediment metagenome TaxID=412755 RepID=A0A0F8W622_9ZZZZ